MIKILVRMFMYMIPGKKLMNISMISYLKRKKSNNMTCNNMTI